MAERILKTSLELRASLTLEMGLLIRWLATDPCRCITIWKNRPFLLLEARDRIGGRILTAEHHGFFPDLGPSWYWPEINPRIQNLVQGLGLTGYPQFEHGLGRFETPDGVVHTVRGTATVPSSWRVNGGMAALTTRLLEKIPNAAIKLNSPVCEIERTSTMICV